MSFTEAIAAGFKNYVNFKGRASRSEFWYWVLFTILLSVLLSTLESMIWAPQAPVQVSGDDLRQNFEQVVSTPTPLTNIASIVLLLPNLSVTARRFHDAGFSAKWLLIQLVPIAYGVFATVGVVTVLSNAPSGQMLTIEQSMSLIFLVIPIFGLFIATFVVFVIFALKPTKSFYDGNKYVEPEPLSSMDEGTTA
jgi:uncharacterized membrane protein YhaH (DUF805 family)